MESNFHELSEDLLSQLTWTLSRKRVSNFIFSTSRFMLLFKCETWVLTRHSLFLYSSSALLCYIMVMPEWIFNKRAGNKLSLQPVGYFFWRTVITATLVGSNIDSLLSAGSLVHRSFSYASLNNFPFLRKATSVAAKCDPTIKMLLSCE